MSRFENDTVTQFGTYGKVIAIDEFSFTERDLSAILKKSITCTLDRFHAKENKNPETRMMRMTLKTKVTDLLLPLKPYTILNPETLDYISKTIFNDPVLTDFILSLKVIFFLELDIPINQRESFFSKLANMIYIEDRDRTIINSQILKRISPTNKDVLKEVLIDNEYIVHFWLCFFWLMGFSLIFYGFYE